MTAGFFVSKQNRIGFQDDNHALTIETKDR
jgi:hypothetical protein